ncbi:ComF family protein [Aquabacter spiritensis]|uniref:ComF family protein n=1 Tax=Aquabacter spiritensis TaxID=933073 RepID=A0A4R3LZU4_9HYPH|nr:ComF family protein [Aquabacter spiritensis]TCT04317.1 ComF family protein [Aquabacter spiritensis]
MASARLRLAFSGARPAGRVASAVARRILDLVLPPTCIGCGTLIREPGGLCGACWRRMSFIERPYCDRLGTPFPFAPAQLGDDPPLSAAARDDPPAFDRARAAVLFGDVSRDLVHRLKYGDRLDLAAPMARLMVRAGADLLREADLILPVPLHPFRLWRRRFNQAALLAHSIADSTGVPVRADLLRRIRATPSQVALHRNARHANVAGAFALSPPAPVFVKNRRILLIDDVMTTGATLDACARILRRGGAKGVDALTFARVVESAGDRL